MIDPDHPIYKPLWSRLLIVGFCAIWTGIELYNGQTFWALIVGALGVYAAYKLFYMFGRGDETKAAADKAQDDRQ